MAQMIDLNVSGTKQVQWGEEIAAALTAHLEHNPLLTEVQRQALGEELPVVRAKVDALAAASTPYAAFLSKGHVKINAEQRVVNYVGDVVLQEAVALVRGRRAEAEKAVPGILSRITSGQTLSRALTAGHETFVNMLRAAADELSLLPAGFGFAANSATALDETANRLDTLNKRRRAQIEAQRAPLRTAVQKASLELRETLYQVNGRLRTHFTDAFIDSLYPRLDRKGRTLIDIPTEDDEDTAAA